MQNKSRLIKLLLLHFLAILFVVLNLFNLKILGFFNLLPFFDLVVIFYFCIYRNIFASWFVFLLGIWLDSLNGALLGLSSLCYIILIRLFIFFNHKMFIRESFMQIWQQFGVFCLLFLAFKYLILFAINDVYYDVWGLVFRYLVTILIYGALHQFFDYLSKKLVEED